MRERDVRSLAVEVVASASREATRGAVEGFLQVRTCRVRVKFLGCGLGADWQSTRSGHVRENDKEQKGKAPSSNRSGFQQGRMRSICCLQASALDYTVPIRPTTVRLPLVGPSFPAVEIRYDAGNGAC